MTSLIFSTGGCPSPPFYSFKRGRWAPFFGENPSREVATKDHSSSNPPKGNPPDLKTKVDVSKVDVKGLPTMPRRLLRMLRILRLLRMLRIFRIMAFLKDALLCESGDPLQRSKLGRTPRGSCNRTLLRRVLRSFFNSKCFLEGFLEGL